MAISTSEPELPGSISLETINDRIIASSFNTSDFGTYNLKVNVSMMSPVYELYSMQSIEEVRIRLEVGKIGSIEPRFLDFTNMIEVTQGEFMSRAFHVLKYAGHKPTIEVHLGTTSAFI